MTDSIKNISDTIKPIAQKYDLTSVWLFGSYARQRQSADSDIDVLVKTEDVADGFKIVDIKYALEEALKKKVDIITTGSIKGSLLENEDLGEMLIYNANISQ